MDNGWRVIAVAGLLLAGVVFGASGKVSAQNCNSVNVECGERECIPKPGGGCEYTGNCLGGWGYDEPVECYDSYGTCRLPQVCAGYGYCTLVVHGSCGGGSGGGGGGGAYQFPTCGGGTTLMCADDPALFVANDSGGLSPSSGQCMNRGLCGDDYFPAEFTVTGCNNSENKGICQDNCDCCAPGEEYVKTRTTGSAYNLQIDCRKGDNEQLCADWDDQLISRSRGTGSEECYCDCPDPDGWCGARCQLNGGSLIMKDVVRCRSVTTTWSCQSTCSATAPSNLTISQ